MTFYQSDQFKTFYTRAQTFEFIRSKKGCQNIFQKRDLLGPRTHQKKAACNFSDVCSKSCFWMFDWWFQKLGGSEPTPDGLALTFEFVRSKKCSFYDENTKNNLVALRGSKNQRNVENGKVATYDILSIWSIQKLVQMCGNFWIDQIDKRSSIKHSKTWFTAKTFFRNAIYLLIKCLGVCLRCVFDTDDKL